METFKAFYDLDSVNFFFFFNVSVAASPLHLLQPGRPALTSASCFLCPSSGLCARLSLFLVHFISIHLRLANSHFTSKLKYLLPKFHIYALVYCNGLYLSPYMQNRKRDTDV